MFVTYLTQQSHETRGRHHADLPRQGLGDGGTTLLFAAAVWVGLQGGLLLFTPFVSISFDAVHARLNLDETLVIPLG